MSVELMGAKLLAPFYGSSLYVWTAVMSITILGLTLGYYLGGKLSIKQSSEKNLAIILAISAIVVIVMPFTSKEVIKLTCRMLLVPGICLSSILLIVPPMFCFGLVGPMAVRLMSQKIETIGNAAGTVYFTSTFGGIIATFLFGYYLIPEIGLKLSSFITASALISLPIIYLINQTTGNRQQTATSYQQLAASRQQQITNNRKPSSVKRPEIKTSIYFFAALEGATVMAVELSVTRMLAPYFGTSLFVWATVIGVTLLSLALGYFQGGKLADKHPEINSIHWVLLGAAAFILCLHFTTQLLMEALAGIDIKTSILIVSLLLILPPLFFLGMIPTLLIRHLTVAIDRGGAMTGRVFTISSASGIVSLLVLGFYVIPIFGLTKPTIIIGLLTGIVPFIKLLAQKKYVVLFFVGFAFVSFLKISRVSETADLKVLHYSEGLLGQLLVADMYKNSKGEESNDRILFINRMGQTFMNRYTNIPKSNYAYYVISAASKLPEHSNVLVLGLGGGSIVNMFQNNLHLNVDAVELDERIAKVAKDYFALSPDVNIIIDDGRHYLETTDKTYDLIFFDACRGEVQPSHLLTSECFKKAKFLLNNNGMIIVNFNGFLRGETGKASRSVYKTLISAGLETKIITTPGKEAERNTIFIGSNEQQNFHQVRSPLLLTGKKVDMDSLFLNIRLLNLKDAIVFTDDKSKLDRLNIKANNIWRKGYNKYFTFYFLDKGIPLFQ